ncbi:hypothetical protein FEM03_05205 [Phragmitibacter flavus]|uniref:HTTM domain-containing protein n=1 Tax=Phragmitibacter flavus TaxID=2576071 RepID=A0A5R8KII2_9BACT|nr:hypothetical protein [Phragmitibacter flavus]TLD72123.1 hypothetical protein FEM03_05205 [Phragmitibacter flavus]
MSFFSQFAGIVIKKPDELPIDRFRLGQVEMLVMRIAFAVLAFVAIKWEVGSLGAADSEKLTGLAHWVNLDWLRNLSPLWLWQTLTVIGLVVYAAGWFPALGLLPALFFSIGIGTLANSQGAINHSTQLVSMILLGQFLVYLVPVHRSVPLSRSSWLRPLEPLQQRAIYVSMVVFAASYVVCGWVKLDASKGEWIQRVPWLALELQKTNYSSYYDTLAPIPETLATVVSLMNEHPNLARIFFGGGLVVELLAFLMLLGRRWALFYGLLIIVLHLSISRLMQLDFWYHMAAALIFLVNVPGIVKTLKK